MTSDQLSPEVDIAKLQNFPNLNGYGFGLSVAVRRGAGVSGIMGSPGDRVMFRTPMAVIPLITNGPR